MGVKLMKQVYLYMSISSTVVDDPNHLLIYYFQILRVDYHL
jgi:hypothetical protein